MAHTLPSLIFNRPDERRLEPSQPFNPLYNLGKDTIAHRDRCHLKGHISKMFDKLHVDLDLYYTKTAERKFGEMVT